MAPPPPDPIRRALLRGSLAAGCAALLPRTTLALPPAAADPAPARFWEADGDTLHCRLCPHACPFPADGDAGRCGVRRRRGDALVSLAWGRCCSEHADPIEKKPLFHVRPGATVHSVAAPGCNLHCRFCQNWQIAQLPFDQVETWERTPEDLAAHCADLRIPLLALTYSEPVVWWEYVLDVARAARERGVDTVAVTNGFISPEPLDEGCRVLRAIKVDFKAFTQRFYADLCGGHLAPVLDALVRIREHGVWLELVHLVIPSLNDDEREVKAMARWIHQSLGDDVPLHFTRFHPAYRLTDLEPTPVATLERCREAARAEGLHFVYLGNVPRHAGENTYCPRSGEVLVERLGHTVVRNRLADGRCPCCDQPVPGVW